MTKQLKQMAVAGLMAAMVGVPMMAQQGTAPGKDDSAVTQKGGADEAAHSWTTEQLLTSTVHEAWMLSGRNEEQFFEMVKQLATMSAQKRGLLLPETDVAGKKAGDLIKREARRDPDQLLYAVVDHAVMKTGTKTPGVAAATASTK